MLTKLTYIGPNPKNKSEYSSKFWFLKLEGRKVILRFGAIGSKGTVQEKVHASESDARNSYNERIRKQLAEGYERVTR